MIVLRKPLVTEKASALNEQGKYGFIVHRKANKVESKKAGLMPAFLCSPAGVDGDSQRDRAHAGNCIISSKFRR